VHTIEVLGQIFHTVLRSSERILFAANLCLLFELVMPLDSCSVASRVRGMLFRLFYLIVGGFFYEGFQFLLSAMHVHPLGSAMLDGALASPHPVLRNAAIVLSFVVAILVGDLFFYWFHRAEHTFGFLWRFHQVHHSIREMSAWNSNFHVIEELLRTLCVALPMAFLFEFKNPAHIWAMVGIFQLIQGTFEHANTRISFGPLRYAFADNRFHRIHHSIESHHYNLNFGAYVPFWDILFRTAYFPKKNEWPDVGLDYAEEPKRLRDYLMMPFTTTLPDSGAAPLGGVRQVVAADAPTLRRSQMSVSGPGQENSPA
jgi:sterol desaturase/sphingolipid hydroxylase (fatty acid hydroxylase superfamily)